MATPGMQIRIAANLAELRRNLAEGKASIETTTAAMQKLATSLNGDKLIQAAHNMTAAVHQIGGAAKLTEAEQRRVNATLDKAIEKYRALGKEAPPAMVALHKATQQADKSAGLLSGTIGKLASAFAIGSLIDRGISGLVSFGKQAFETAGKINDLADKTGLSIKATQQLSYLANQSGGSIEQYADTVFRLGVNLEQGGDRARKSIAALGLGYEQIRALKPEQQFDAIMRALSGVESITERNRIGVELMGKAYANVAAAVDGYNEKMAEAPIASDAAVKATDAAGDAMVRTWERAKAAAINAIGGIILAWEEAQKNFSARGQSTSSLMGPFAGSAFGVGARAGAFVREQNTLTLPTVGAPSRGGLPSVGGVTPEIMARLTAGPSAATIATAEALQKRLDVLTGKALQNQVRQLASDVALAGRQGGLTAFQYAELGAQLSKMRAQGAVLPPILDDIRLAHDKLAFSTKVLAFNSREAQAAMRGMGMVGLQNKQTVTEMTAAMNAKILPFGANKSLPGRMLSPDVLTAPPESASKQYGQKLSGTIINAAMGGGSITGALGAQIGNDIGAKLASSAGGTLEKVFGKTVGGAITAAIPGIGALLGPLAGKLTGWVVGLFTGGEGAKANDLRDSLKTQIAASIAGLENDPAIRNALNRFNTAGSRENVQKAADDIQKAAQAAKDAMAKYGLTLDDVGTASERLARQTKVLTEDFTRLRGLGFTIEQIAAGGADQLNTLIGTALETGQQLPAALEPYIEQLIRSGGLTDELARKILGVANPVPWQDMLAAAEKYGISIDALGAKFEQARLDDTAAQLAKDWQLLADNGADINGVMAGMKDEVQDLIDKALKLGLTIPDSMRPLVEKLFEAGELTDENGNKLEDLSKINFAAPIISDVDRLIEKMDELIDRIAGVGSGLDGLPDVDLPEGGSSGGNDGTSGYPNPQYDDPTPMATGGIVRARRGGTVVRVGEAGQDEAIVPLPAGLGRGGSGRVVIENVIMLDGEVIGRATARNLPEALERLGVAI